MGNIQSLPIDSYLDRHPCSGRNITWHYIHTNGSLPAPYSQCPYASEILSSHCCAHGACGPSWFDREYGRYQYANWDGLGDPFNDITNTTIGDWRNGTSNSTVASGNNRFERPASDRVCLGMEPSLWFVQNHWPPLGLDGRPVEHFRQMKWGNSSARDEIWQKQAMDLNPSARSGRSEHRVVTSGAAQMKTITIWKLATCVWADLKAALWKTGTPMNTVGFFMGTLLGYLICLGTNGGLTQSRESQPSRLRALQTQATSPRTSTAKVNKKKKKSRNKTVASQHDDHHVSNGLTPPISQPAPAHQNNDSEASDVPTHPQAPRNGASEDSDLQVPNDLIRPQAPRNEPSQDDDLQAPDVPVAPQAPRDGASQNNDPQVLNHLTPPISPRSPAQNYFLIDNSSTTRNEASQSSDPQIPNDLAPPISPSTPVLQDNYLAVGSSSTPPRYNVRERRRRHVDWGSLRRTDNAGSQSIIETSSQQGSQPVPQRVSKQGNRAASTNLDSQQVGAQHRNPSTRPRQRLS